MFPPAYIIELRFLIVLHRREWILFLNPVYISVPACLINTHAKWWASPWSSPCETLNSSLLVKVFPEPCGQAQHVKKTY